MSFCHNTNFHKLSTMRICVLWMHTSQYSQVKKNIQKYYLPSMKMLMYPIYASFFFSSSWCVVTYGGRNLSYNIVWKCNAMWREVTDYGRPERMREVMSIGCLFMLPNSKICYFFLLELLLSPSPKLWRRKKECCGLVHCHLWSLKLFKIWHS